MRILHVPYCYYPDAVGGTEVYVRGLVGAQRAQGCEAAVAAPGGSRETYRHEGVAVFRFPVSAVGNLRELYGEGDRAAAESFGGILEEFSPDVVHLHALTRAVSVRLVKEAKARGIPVVLNYHTPTVSCSRGTLLRWGAEICDGQLDGRTCGACTLQARGVVRPVAGLLAALPVAVGRELGRLGLSGGWVTAARMSELMDVRIQAFRELMALVDRVVALCCWTRDLLIRNGVPAGKIVLSRQGIEYEPRRYEPRERRSPVRAAFLGRLDPTKGLHVVLEALAGRPELAMELDLFVVRQGDGGGGYAAKVCEMAGRDRRIRMLPPVGAGEVIETLRGYDVLVVPSQWLETGPLVVLEAFAAGIPVIGSKLGGIAELVRAGVDGILVDPAGSVEAWGKALQMVCGESGLLTAMAANTAPPRHARQAASDFAVMYQELLANRRVAAAIGASFA